MPESTASGGARLVESKPISMGPRRLAVSAAVVLLVVSSLALAGSLNHGGSASPAAIVAASSTIPLGPGANYPTYLDNAWRTDNGGWQGPINTSDAHELQNLWSYATGGPVWSQPIVVNGIVYVGSSDGYEYALYATNGTFIWRTYLGIDSGDPGCGGGQPGVTSTATFVPGGTLYVSGGNGVFYSLSAATGHVLWSLPIGGTNSTYQGVYLWASPLIYNHSAYIGIASQCDIPMVPAGLERVSLNTHKVLAYFNSSAPEPNGSSIWGSPSINEKTNTVFVATGNPYQTLNPPYDEAIVALNASTLAVQASWQVPVPQRIPDGDFGVTPTLFNLTNGVGVVAAENKNGWIYEWYQSNMTLIWQRDIAALPYDHYSASYANGRLYVVAHGLTVGNISYNSSITALNPANGAILWQVGTPSSPGGGYEVPLITNDVLVVPIATELYVLNAITGHIMFQEALSGVSTPPASVSRGEIFVGDGDSLLALQVALGLKSGESRHTGVAPLTVDFTASPTGGVPAYRYAWTFGDGTTSSAQNPAHVYTTPGNYTVDLTVTDLTGGQVVATLTVVVTTPTLRRKDDPTADRALSP